MVQWEDNFDVMCYQKSAQQHGKLLLEKNCETSFTHSKYFTLFHSTNLKNTSLLINTHVSMYLAISVSCENI